MEKNQENIECAHMFVHKEPTKSPYDLLQTTNPAKNCAQNSNGIVFHPKWQKNNIHRRKNKTAHKNSVQKISLLSIMHSKMSFRVILW